MTKVIKASCPFCGSRPEDGTVKVVGGDGRDAFCVACFECTCNGPLSATEDGAIARWNKRPPGDPDAGVPEGDVLNDIAAGVAGMVNAFADALRAEAEPDGSDAAQIEATVAVASTAGRLATIFLMDFHTIAAGFHGLASAMSTTLDEAAADVAEDRESAGEALPQAG